MDEKLYQLNDWGFCDEIVQAIVKESGVEDEEEIKEKAVFDLVEVVCIRGVGKHYNNTSEQVRIPVLRRCMGRRPPMEELNVTVQRLAGAGDAQQAYCCMTEVPTPWPQALCQCREWVARNLGEHIEGFHVQLESGEVAGHLYYAFSEKALIPYKIEERVGVLYCEWVQRRYQGKGLGQSLFKAFLEEMESQAVKGILVENTETDGEGHLKRYLGLGFKVVSETERGRLLYLPIVEGEVEFHPLEARIRPRQGVPIEILVIGGYMCPYEAATLLLLQEVSREFGDRVVLQQVPLTKETLQEYGVARGIFINGRPGLAGAETEESVRQAIQEAL